MTIFSALPTTPPTTPQPVMASTKPPQKCPFNHIKQCPQDGGPCSCVFDTPLRDAWGHANTTCLAYQSQLPVLKSAKHWSSLVSTGKPESMGQLWIGLKHDVLSGQWLYADNSVHHLGVDYAPWGAHQPNLTWGHCVVSTSAFVGNGWGMHDCADNQVQFVCFIPPPEYCNPYDLDYTMSGGSTNGTSLANWVTEGTSVKHECMDEAEFPDGTNSVIHTCQNDGNWTYKNYICSGKLLIKFLINSFCFENKILHLFSVRS